MLLKGSQRGGAKQLGIHLMNMDDNDHVEIHEIKSFMSNDIVGALKEAYGVSKGTKCRQFLFSVSLSPPPEANVDIATFEKAIQQIEEKNKLTNQPRIIVFHEKYGRRHAHVVWSRIDAQTMTAKNLPHFKLKLRDISRSLFIENNWKMPEGLMNSEKRCIRNFTLAEWQEARRNGYNAGDLKEIIQECWAASDTKSSFTNALNERGFLLAKGDRGRYVTVFHTGQVFAVTNATGKRKKEIEARLGSVDDLPTVDVATNQTKGDVLASFRHMAQENKIQSSIRTAETENPHRRAQRSPSP